MPARGYVKNNGKCEFLGVRLTTEEFKKLKILSELEGTSMSFYVRKIINEQYSEHARTIVDLCDNLEPIIII